MEEEINNKTDIRKIEKELIIFLNNLKIENINEFDRLIKKLKKNYRREEILDIYCQTSDDVSVRFYYSKILKFRNGIINIMNI